MTIRECPKFCLEHGAIEFPTINSGIKDMGHGHMQQYRIVSCPMCGRRLTFKEGTVLGFATLTLERRKALAKIGAEALTKKGNRFRLQEGSDLAKRAGAKGGAVTARRKKERANLIGHQQSAGSVAGSSEADRKDDECKAGD
jgi:hypothetical protein